MPPTCCALVAPEFVPTAMWKELSLPPCRQKYILFKYSYPSMLPNTVGFQSPAVEKMLLVPAGGVKLWA